MVHPRPATLIHLLTGAPEVGKTTIIQTVVQRLKVQAGGFITREVREGSQRVGFEIVTLRGEVGLLATTAPAPVFAREGRLEQFRVNLDVVDRLAVPALTGALQYGYVVVDEIGPMETMSPLFRATVWSVLDQAQWVLGSIVLRSEPFADQVKQHPRVAVTTVTPENRDAVATRMIEGLVGAIEGRSSL